jgi:lectin-like protein
MLGSPRLLRGGLASHHCVGVAMGIWLGCTAPSGESLYQPLPPEGAAGASGAGGTAIAGTGGTSSGGTGGTGGVGTIGEGQGGLPISGGAGGNAGAAASDGPDASVGGTSSIDAGVSEDAGPTPIECVVGDEVCDGIDNDCDGVVDQGATCAAACRGFAIAGHGYMFCAEAVDRGIALSRCEAQGMKLAWIETPEENAALVQGIAALGLENPDDAELLAQIGASDSNDETEWTWIGDAASLDGFVFWRGDAADDGGEAVDGAYQNWASGEPNDDNGEDCGVLSVLGSDNREAGQWDDRNCDIELPFLCEVP